MKNLFKSIMMVAVAAISLTSCSNNFTDEVVSNEKIDLNITAVNDEITRSVFGEPSEGKYPTLWEGKEKFVLNVNENTGKTTESVEASFSADLRTVNLKAQLELSSAPESYTVYAMVPQSACVFAGITAGKGWQVNVPTLQTTGANSCDPAAQILVGASDTKESAAETFNMTFKHAVAYGKMTLTNLNLNGATINSVVIESEKNIAGRFYINNKTAAYTDNSPSSSITVKTSSVENIWFALAPADVSNTVLKIVVNTDKGTLTKSVTMPANRKFEIGKISTFKVDMTGVELVSPVVYTLLTDVNDLKIGDQVIIAAAKSDVAISATQNSNNRAIAAITKSDDKSTLSDPAKTVEIFTVENGVTSGTYSFKAQKKEGYIFAASSNSNQLRTQETNDANSSWSVSVTSAGIATIKATGTNTRNWLRFNSGSNLFSCYGNGQDDVVIYHREGEEQEPDTAPKIIPAQTTLTIEADESYAQVALTLNNITDIVNVAYEADWIDDAYIEDNILYITAVNNDTTNEREAVFTLSANGAEAIVTLVQKGALPVVEESLPEIDKTAYYTFRKAATFSSAKWYAIVANGKAATAITSDYGYLQVVATEADDTIVLPADCAFGFTSTNGGYLIQQSDNRYMYQTGSYNSFNVSSTVPSDGGVWSVDYTSGEATIKNNSVEKWFQYDGGYNSYGSYDTQKGVNPTLYELVEVYNEPILVSLNPTELSFAYEGGSKSVTATTYATATLSVTSNVDWATAYVSGNTITITAAENSTTETRNGVITVTYGNDSKTVAVAQGGVPTGGSITTTLSFVNNATFNKWDTSYTARTIEFDEATVKFTSANKQSGTITNMPVTKGQPVEIVMKNGCTLQSITFKCKQWTSKKQTITLHNSTDGGKTYNQTTTTSSDFTLTAGSLPEGTNAVKFTFSSSSNQIGIDSAEITYVN